MRIYTLQVHNSGDVAKFDDLYHYADFANLRTEFRNRVEWLKERMNVVEEVCPQIDENGEVRGGFKFVNADGTMIAGEVYDYDILDDD